MKISACLVIRNEEKLLPRALESISNVVDEIIIVHDGPCADKSLDIAKDYNALVFVREFVGEAEYHRPFSFEKAKGDWVLQLDADEFLSKKAKSELRNLSRSEKYDGFSFLWPYFDGKKYIEKGPFSKTYKPCFFRKSKMYMIGISHEYPRTYGKIKKRMDILLEHKPQYNNFSKAFFDKKWKKWALIQAKQIINIEKAPLFNIHSKHRNSTYLYYLRKRKSPYLYSFLEIIKFSLIYLKSGIITAGLSSWKIAYHYLKYILLMHFEIARQKNHEKK